MHLDFLSTAFLLLILVASGAIAWAADKLGKKLGKKRLSIRVGRWSLRPKHVAALGTIVMGVVVSFLTIVFIALVSRDAREWLFQGRGLLLQRDRYARDVQSQKGQLADLGRLIATARTQAAAAQERYAGLQAQYQDLGAKVTDLNAKLKTSVADFAKSQADLVANRSELARVQRQLPPLRTQVVVAQRQVAAAKADLARTKQGLVAAKKDLGTAGLNLKDAYKQLKLALNKSLKTYQDLQVLTKQVADLEEEKKTQESLVASLREQIASRVGERDEAETNAKLAQIRYADVQEKLRQAGKDLDEILNLAQQQNLLFRLNLRTSRLAPLTFHVKEEVARIPVPAHSSEDATARALVALLHEAKDQAAGRGAKPGGDYEAADVVDRVDSRTGAKLTSDQLKRNVVAGAANRPQDQVLVATSSLNAFAGEPVSLDIAIAPNPVVYHRNDMVAEARIDGSKDEGEILDQLSLFVRSRVREQAEGRRMIPRAGADAPFGEVKTSDVLALVRDVKKEGRAVRVQAFAGGDTRAADPLKLEFRVR